MLIDEAEEKFETFILMLEALFEIDDVKYKKFERKGFRLLRKIEKIMSKFIKKTTTFLEKEEK